jgi:hypothetical protein
LVGSERFAPDADQERVNELDMLRKYLTEATEAVDKCVLLLCGLIWLANELGAVHN